MNRALPFLLLVAVIAGGLGFFAFQAGSRRPASAPNGSPETSITPTAAPRPKAPAPEPKAAELAAVETSRSDAALRGGGPSESWEIIPMNGQGQLMADARITATQGSDVRTSSGRTKWTRVPSGEWTLVVESEGNPLWERELVLGPDEKRRTAAYLGVEIRIEGEAIDTAGEPLGKTPIFFLPPGVAHPSRRDMQPNPEQPRKAAVAMNGAVRADLTAAGKFRARLPHDGAWRVSVGPPGRARWTEKEGTELTYGGPDRADVTVPAYSSLTMTFDAPDDERPSQVSAFFYDPELAQAHAENQAELYRQSDPRSIAEAQRLAKREAMEAEEVEKLRGLGYGDGSGDKDGKSGTARRTADENRGFQYGADSADGERLRKTPQAMFDPGWRMVRSARVTDEGRAVLANLEGGTDYRFLFIRGQERITTAPSYRLARGQASVASTKLPPPGTSPSEGVDNRATLTLKLSDEAQDVERVAGVVWRL